MSKMQALPLHNKEAWCAVWRSLPNGDTRKVWLRRASPETATTVICFSVSKHFTPETEWSPKPGAGLHLPETSPGPEQEAFSAPAPGWECSPSSVVMKIQSELRLPQRDAFLRDRWRD